MSGIFLKIEVLDHGYVSLVESWGSDERIIESARMSTDKGFEGWGPHRQTCAWLCTEGVLPCDCPQDHVGDEKLLRFLWEHKHATPFEMAGAIFEVQAPIMVFREWHRHRTQSYNEMSGRYTVLPDLYYVPGMARLRAAKQDKKNKQGSMDGFSDEEAIFIQAKIETAQHGVRAIYEELLEKGVSREVARLVLPVSQYSRMRASANLRNWLAFLTLRMDQSAQWEIRQYAYAVHEILSSLFPRTLSLFDEGSR